MFSQSNDRSHSPRAFALFASGEERSETLFPRITQVVLEGLRHSAPAIAKKRSDQTYFDQQRPLIGDLRTPHLYEMFQTVTRRHHRDKPGSPLRRLKDSTGPLAALLNQFEAP